MGLPRLRIRIRRGLGAFASTLLPGSVQLLVGRSRAACAVAFLVGLASLANLLFGAYALRSMGVESIDPFSAMGTPNILEMYPASLGEVQSDRTALQFIAETGRESLSVERLRPILPPGRKLPVDAYFWASLACYGALYLLCALWGGWDYLRETTEESGPARFSLGRWSAVRHAPLSLQITVVILLALGFSLGAGFYPALKLYERQLEREREAALPGLAAGIALGVAERAEGREDDARYRAGLERTLSVGAARRQIVSVEVASRREELRYRWENPALAALKAPDRAVAVRVPAQASEELGRPGGPTAYEEQQVFPGIQRVKVFVRGGAKGDLATLTLELSRVEAEAQMARLKRRQWVAAALALLLVLVASALLVRQISRPIGELAEKMARVARGDLDATVVPSGAREVLGLGHAFNAMAAGLKEGHRLKAELEAAQAVQAYLLPKEAPKVEGYRLEGLCLPATEVGGDFFHYYLEEGERLSIVVGDVSGKGMKAAMLTSLILGSLQSLVRERRAAGEVVERLNDVLCREVRDRSFATLLFCDLDRPTGRVTFANAGHLYPFRFAAAAGRWEEVAARRACLPTGIAPGESYETGELFLAPGDRLLLMSDGLVEAKDAAGGLFGYGRLTETLAGTTGDGGREVLPRLVAAVKAFSGDAPQADDLTVVLLERV